MYYKRYDNAEKILYANLNSFIEKKVFDNKRIYMFGTSRIASMIVTFLAEHGVKIDGFLDNAASTQGYKMLDLWVYSPDSLRNFDKDNVILVASSYQNEMIMQMKDMGYKEGDNIIKVIDLPELMDDYSFVDRTGYVEMPKKEIRKRMVNMMKFLKKICDENGIDYYLAGGTLLGAVRHKGFIPWDDDVDIYIKGKQLDFLTQIINQSDRYQLLTYKSCNEFSDSVPLLVDCDSVMDINRFPLQAVTGISIDIMPLYGIPDDEIKLKEYVEMVKRLDMKRWNCLSDREKCYKAIKELTDYLESFDMEQSENIGFILSSYYLKEMFPKSCFLKKKYLDFEGDSYCVAGEYEKILGSLYGDYWELPPVDKREARHYFRAYYSRFSDIG